MFNIKNVVYFACIILYCSILIPGEPKHELTPFERLPTELQVNITEMLPETELNKMSLISKALYNANYLVLKEHRRRAFQNYLLYPFLSSVFKEQVFAELGRSSEYYATAERETLSELLQDSENKSFFNSILLKDAHRTYFKSNSWLKSFNLCSRQYYKNLVTRITPCTKDRKSHKTINKVFIVHISQGILSQIGAGDVAAKCVDTLYSNIHRAGKAKEEDRVRIVIDDIDIYNKDILLNLNILAVKFEFLNLLISNITKHHEDNKIPKINLIKAIDLTTYDDPMLHQVINTIFSLIKGIPEEIQLQVNYSPQLFSKKLSGEIKNTIFRPNFFIPMAHQLANQTLPDENLMNVDNLKLLCKNGFALGFIGNIIKFLFQQEESFERDKQIVRILSEYISPFTRDPDVHTILDKLFFASTRQGTSDQLSKKVTELFFSTAENAGVDLNKYIIINLSATPLQAAINFLKNSVFHLIQRQWSGDRVRQSNHKTYLFILQLAQKGVDLSSEFNNRVMKSFFQEMHLFEGYKQKLIFDSLTDNEIVPKIGKNIYQRVTKEGDTLLHVYFKHSKVLNNDIMLKILNRIPDDMINAKNKQGESILECYMHFLRQYREKINISTLSIITTLPNPDSFVAHLLERGFDLRTETSAGQTYVDFITSLIEENMQMNSMIIDFEKHKVADFMQRILSNILPLQGKIEKGRSRW